MTTTKIADGPEIVKLAIARQKAADFLDNLDLGAPENEYEAAWTAYEDAEEALKNAVRTHIEAGR
jgi:hypothetical protein